IEWEATLHIAEWHDVIDMILNFLGYGDIGERYIFNHSVTLQNCQTNPVSTILIRHQFDVLIHTGGTFHSRQVSSIDGTNLAHSVQSTTGIEHIGTSTNQIGTVYTIVNGQRTTAPDFEALCLSAIAQCNGGIQCFIGSALSVDSTFDAEYIEPVITSRLDVKQRGDELTRLTRNG